MASTVDALKIITDAQTYLYDKLGVRWDELELLSWLNAGQLEIAMLVPNSSSFTVAIKLAAGVKQTTATGVLRIIEFVRNMGVDGITPGTELRVVDRKVLTSYLPNWSNDTPDSAVKHVMYNAEDDNETFYVWPPQPAANQGYIEVVQSQVPATVSNISVGTKISVHDYYANALTDYILYRAFGKDSEYGNQDARSQLHYKQFAQTMGIVFKNDTNASNRVVPNQQAR